MDYNPTYTCRAPTAPVMPDPPGYRANKAASDLARLTERQLGYSEGHIDPIALRLFICAYWDRISVLHHDR
jgi:hypothetical protein